MKSNFIPKSSVKLLTIDRTRSTMILSEAARELKKYFRKSGCVLSREMEVRVRSMVERRNHSVHRDIPIEPKER